MVESITTVIQCVTKGYSNDQPGPSGEPPKRRARVQMKSGEVLTTDEAAARVQAEEKAKSDKIAEKAEKQRVAAAAKQARLELAAANKAAREKIAADRAAAKAAKTVKYGSR